MVEGPLDAVAEEISVAMAGAVEEEVEMTN